MDRVRFGRSQKFQLSPRGLEATAAYTVMIEAARGGSGRGAFDASRAAWGAPRGLTGEDGLYLVEFGAEAKSIQEASRNLETCGVSAREVRTAVDRLLACGMLEPVPVPVPAAPPRRW